MTDETMTITAGENYTLTEAANFLRCSYGFLYNRLIDGKVGHAKMGNRYIIKGAELLRLSEVGLD